MRSPVADLLADLSAGLDSVHTAWFLFGAQAAILYGTARLTADVDVTVLLPPDVSIVRLQTALAEHGLALRFGDEAFVARTRVLPLAHVASGIPVDVVIAGPGLEEVFLARAVSHDVEGVTVPVASAEDLVIMKVIAARAKDLDDVAAIIVTQFDRFDEQYVRDILRAIEVALGQSDLLPVFDRVVAGLANGQN
jgi:hypothetical protein